MRRILLIGAVLLAASCGGGGGGGGDPFYGGIWDYSGLKIVDPCASSLPSVMSVRLTVNQSPTEVVVNSGSITLTGTTNDKDGFIVSGPGPRSSNCASGYAYEFSDASDGEADVVLAMVVRCGSQECAVGYGGTAVRNGNRTFTRSVEGIDLDEATKTLAEQCLEGGGETIDPERAPEIEAAAAKRARALMKD